MDVFACVNLFLFKQKIACLSSQLGTGPGSASLLSLWGRAWPAWGGAGAGLRDPHLAAGGGQAVPGGEAPAPSSTRALCLSPCAGGLVGLLGMWSGGGGGNSAVPHAPSCVPSFSLPGWVSVGVVVHVQVSAALWLPHSCLPGGCLVLQAGSRQVPGSPHHTPPRRGCAAPAAPKRDRGGNSKRERAKNFPVLGAAIGWSVSLRTP